MEPSISEQGILRKSHLKSESNLDAMAAASAKHVNKRRTLTGELAMKMEDGANMYVINETTAAERILQRSLCCRDENVAENVVAHQKSVQRDEKHSIRLCFWEHAPPSASPSRLRAHTHAHCIKLGKLCAAASKHPKRFGSHVWAMRAQWADWISKNGHAFGGVVGGRLTGVFCLLCLFVIVLLMARDCGSWWPECRMLEHL